MISAFDIFKIGIGPSSSHTVGPMNAGKCFIDRLIDSGDLPRTTRITVDLYGSLSLTGKGHATDTAVIMGLAGNTPQDVNIDSIPAFIQEVARSSRLSVAGGAHVVDFPVADSIFFHAETLARHETVCVLPPGTDKRRFYTKRITLLAAALLSKRNALASRTT